MSNSTWGKTADNEEWLNTHKTRRNNHRMDRFNVGPTGSFSRQYEL